MKYKDLKINSEAELKKMLLDLRSEVHKLEVKNRLGQLKQNHKIKQIKKDIARILTLLNTKPTI